MDGVRYEEIFITDYETDISGLYDCLGEYESIDELNYLASMLDDMDEGEQAKFEAALSYGDYTGSLKDLINLAQNLDCYEYCPGISDEDDLGRYMIDEMGAMEVPEYLENYIDYEAYGRDVSLEDGGHFAEGRLYRQQRRQLHRVLQRQGRSAGGIQDFCLSRTVKIHPRHTQTVPADD